MKPVPLPPDDLDDSDWAPRKLTHEQARQEQLNHSATRTPVQRLEAMTELNRRMFALRGIDLADTETDWTPSRVRRIRR